MKHLLKGVLVFAVTILFFTCKKDTTGISQIITTARWTVNYYHNNGVDLTSSFNGYVFTFTNDDSVKVSNGTSVIATGTWRADDSKNELHLIINSPFDSINKGWIVFEKTNTDFKLKDDNTVSTEELHFIKD